MCVHDKTWLSLYFPEDANAPILRALLLFVLILQDLLAAGCHMPRLGAQWSPFTR